MQLSAFSYQLLALSRGGTHGAFRVEKKLKADG
jgi:hypothetical protein